jgi:hypothetical protein
MDKVELSGGIQALVGKTALLVFWGKWYWKLQNCQSVEAGKLDLWFISLAYHLIYGRAGKTYLIICVSYQFNVKPHGKVPPKSSYRTKPTSLVPTSVAQTVLALVTATLARKGIFDFSAVV